MLPSGLKIKRVGSIREIVQDYSSPFGGIFDNGPTDKAKRWQKIAEGNEEEGGLMLHLDEKPEEEEVGKGQKRKQPPRIMPLPKGWHMSDWSPESMQRPSRPSSVELWPERLRRAYEEAAVQEGEFTGSVPMARIDGMMERAGHRITWKNVVGQLCNQVASSPNHLTREQVHELFQRYEVRILEGLDRVFKMRSRAGKAAMPYAKLEEVVRQQGFTPLPQSMLDLAVEAAELLRRQPTPSAEDMIRAMGGEPCPAPARSRTLNHARTSTCSEPAMGATLSMTGTMTLPGMVSIPEGDSSEEDDVPWGVFINLCELLVRREGFSARESFEFELVFRRFDEDHSGIIEASEWKSILAWLGFLSDESIAESLENLLEDVAGGVTGRIDLDKFHVLMRSHRAIEYAYTRELFRTCDGDGTGELQPHELFVLFKKLGLCIPPETLSEMVEDSQVPYQVFSFTSFWKILQIIRHRDGFASGEMRDIGKAYSTFCEKRETMSTRFVPHALRWLGYLLGTDLVEKVPWRSEMANQSSVSEAEFFKIVRHHAEADLRSTRMVFREYAEERGAQPLRGTARLSYALNKLCTDYPDVAGLWLSQHMHQKFDHERPEDVCFDFEEFWRIARGCREMVRDRHRKHHGFSDERRKSLQKSFESLLPDPHRPALPPSALVELFKVIMPAVQTSRELRELLKEALIKHRCQSTGMDWAIFLDVMRSFEDLVEGNLADATGAVCEAFQINAQQADELLDVYIKYLFTGADGLTTLDLMLLFEESHKQTLGAPSTPSGSISGALSAPPAGRSMSEVFEAAEAAASAAVASRQMPSAAQIATWRDRVEQLQELRGWPGTVDKWLQFVKELREHQQVRRRAFLTDPLSPVPESRAPMDSARSYDKKEYMPSDTPTTVGSRPTTKGDSRPATRSESRPGTSQMHLGDARLGGAFPPGPPSARDGSELATPGRTAEAT